MAHEKEGKHRPSGGDDLQSRETMLPLFVLRKEADSNCCERARRAAFQAGIPTMGISPSRKGTPWGALVPIGGLEPPRRFRHRPLKPARLPFRQTGLVPTEGVEPSHLSVPVFEAGASACFRQVGLVRHQGLEPWTRSLKGNCSDQLS